jgi:hypothetical protein
MVVNLNFDRNKELEMKTQKTDLLAFVEVY